MDASVTINTKVFSLVSMTADRSQRAQRGVGPSTPNTLVLADSVSKNGTRRQQTGFVASKLDSVTGKSYTRRVYLVEEYDPSVWGEEELDVGLSDLVAALGDEAFTDARRNLEK